MPIPTPVKGEDQQTYIGRCQSILNKEYPEEEQRSGICFSQWRKHIGKKDSADNIENRTFIFKIDNNRKKSKFFIDKDTGFLHCEAYFTRTGVFDYYDENGNLLRELRPEDEVFSSESLDSLKLKPIVEDHPDKKITIENIKDFQIGTIGENLTREDTYVKGSMIITDKNMIETVIARKKMGLNTELSCGYSCKVIPEIGEHRQDGYYTFKQKDIKYNHVGIVDNGRAGSNVRILDKNQNKYNNNLNKNKKGNIMPDIVKFNRKSINLDSFKMDALSGLIPEDNMNIFDILSNKLDEAVDIIKDLTSKEDEAVKTIKDFTSKKDELQGKVDQLSETVEKQKKDIVELSDVNSERITNMIKVKNDIMEIANKLKVDINGKDFKSIKIDCIKAVSEKFDAEGKNDTYINGRFDSIREGLINSQKQDGSNAIGQFIVRAKDASGGKTKLSPREEFLKKDKESRKKE